MKFKVLDQNNEEIKHEDSILYNYEGEKEERLEQLLIYGEDIYVMFKDCEKGTMFHINELVTSREDVGEIKVFKLHEYHKVNNSGGAM